MMDEPITNPEPLVLYDGECGLCDRTVQFLVKLDRHGRLRYAPLQGETAERLIGKPDMSSMVFVDPSGFYTRSTAALMAMREAGGIGKLIGLAIWVPRPIRDLVYGFIARNRIRWFGRVDACRLPTPELAKRLLP